MEKEQKAHIEANMMGLIENTQMNAIVLPTLQAGLSLHRIDVDTIETTQRTSGAFAASKVFYDIMMTRANSYELLIKALDDARQSGASAILKRLPGRSAAAAAVAVAMTNPASKLKIGDDCDLDDIVDVLRSSPSTEAMYQRDWQKLARKLQFKSAEIDGFRRKLVGLDFTLFDLLYQMMEEWQAKKGEEATLGKLIEIAEQLGWRDFAEKLLKKFS